MNGFIIVLTIFMTLLTQSAGNLTDGKSDAAVKTDISRVMAAVNSYQANNRGRTPDPAYIDSGDFFQEYLNDGSDMNITAVRSGGKDSSGTATIHLAKKCDGTAANARTFSVSTLLSDGSRFCQDI
jgi:hypothetical protein